MNNNGSNPAGNGYAGGNGNVSCTASLLTLNGSFTIFDVASQSTFYSNTSGYSVINGCTMKVASSSAQVDTVTSGTGSSVSSDFWGSVFPLIFVVAVSITLSYVLFLISFMARTRRPWLQRCGALGAIVTLTLAADLIWSVLQSQQNQLSYYNADSVRNVRANTALKAVRIVSETILWLAQVQVLIRLFPRHRDKVIIKWSGLCLIVLVTVFTVLNDFFHPSPYNPTSTNALIPAIPALTYLFQIAIGVLYAACVIFYSLTSGRWRFAYCLRILPFAIASLASVFAAVIFFCLDIWSAKVEGWGDYIRLASVVAAVIMVWDWVDQVEACISKDSHNGVLGREVFEDEMNDGKAKHHKHDHDNKSSRLFPKNWKTKTTRKSQGSSQTDVIELPIIVHPIQRAQSTHLESELASNGSQISGYSQVRKDISPSTSLRNISDSGSNQPNHRRYPNTAPSHLHNLDTSGSRTSHEQSHSSSPSVQNAPVHDDWQNLVVQPGFSSGDYWPDEKETH